VSECVGNCKHREIDEPHVMREKVYMEELGGNGLIDESE